MVYKFGNRARMSVSGTPGTGTITLGTAMAGFQTFTASLGAGTQFTVPYVIEDTGAAWELGEGTYTVSGTTLARTSIVGSSAGGAAISVTSAAEVYIAPLADDLQWGTQAYNLVQLDASARIPAVDASLVTNLNGTAIASGTVPVARLPVGTAANQIVQLDASAKIPAVDGSQVQFLNGSNITSGTVSATYLPVGTTASKIVQLDGTAKLPAVDGSQLTNIPAPASIPASAITSGTIAAARLNIGTTANQLLALDASAKIPAVDGSQITNIVAASATTATTATTAGNITGLVGTSGSLAICDGAGGVGVSAIWAIDTGTGAMHSNGYNLNLGSGGGITMGGATFTAVYCYGATFGSLGLAYLAGSASDRSLKDNIHTLSSESASSIIKSLRPVSFTWKKDVIGTPINNGLEQHGIIAQEAEYALPGAILYAKPKGSDEIKLFDYNQIIAPLISVVQQLMREVAELKAKK